MKLVIIELPSGCVPRNTSCTYSTYHSIILKDEEGRWFTGCVCTAVNIKFTFKTPAFIFAHFIKTLCLACTSSSRAVLCVRRTTTGNLHNNTNTHVLRVFSHLLFNITTISWFWQSLHLVSSYQEMQGLCHLLSHQIQIHRCLYS